MISPELLRRHPAFAGAREESLKRLAMIGEERAYRTGDIVFDRSEQASHLYLVTEGEVDLQSWIGDDRKTVDTLVGGDLMCFSAVVEPYKTHLSGVARKPTRAVAIEAAGLRTLLEEDPAFGYGLMHAIARTLSHRLQGAQIQLATRG